jgi:hypothetical protein
VGSVSLRRLRNTLTGGDYRFLNVQRGRSLN